MLQRRLNDRRAEHEVSLHAIAFQQSQLMDVPQERLSPCDPDLGADASEMLTHHAAGEAETVGNILVREPLADQGR
jgi:hypothetical protein